jgi:hypothetical protein
MPAAAVDAKFAEPVRLSFMKDGRPDPGRRQVVVNGMLLVGVGKNTTAGANRTSSWRTRITSGKAELHLDRTQYDGPVPKEGDKVRAVSRPGMPLFDVLAVDDRSHTRIVVQLGEA